MKREDIRIRDPFVLLHNNMYYMYASAETRMKDDNDKSLVPFGDVHKMALFLS